MDRLLSFHGSKKTTGVELFIESELTMSERPRLTDGEARRLQKTLDEKGLKSLSMDERWDLYRYWHGRYMKELDKRTDEHREEYRYLDGQRNISVPQYFF